MVMLLFLGSLRAIIAPIIAIPLFIIKGHFPYEYYGILN
ncbi:hypothetical protein [Francisella-like endosymbiont]